GRARYPSYEDNMTSTHRHRGLLARRGPGQARNSCDCLSQHAHPDGPSAGTKSGRSVLCWSMGIWSAPGGSLDWANEVNLLTGFPRLRAYIKGNVRATGGPATHCGGPASGGSEVRAVTSGFADEPVDVVASRPGPVHMAVSAQPPWARHLYPGQGRSRDAPQ